MPKASRRWWGWLVGILMAAVPAQGETPEAIWQAVEDARLEPQRAVAVENLKLATGLGTLQIDRGTVVPASQVGDRPIELVFVGEARMMLEPPDEIEASQLELFTDHRRLDEVVTAAVLVLASDAAVDAVLARPKASVDETKQKEAEDLYARWRDRPERRLLGIDLAMLRDAVGDPSVATYFAGWFQGETLGAFLYVNEPDAREQVSLGQFTAIDATEREKRKLARGLHKAQRKGRLIGLTVDDFGQWDTWLSTSPRDAAGQVIVGAAAFEPEHYALDVALDDDKEHLRGTARLDLRARAAGRTLPLTLASDLTVDAVRLAGAPVFFRQANSTVVVVLPEAVPAGTALSLEVDYGGAMFDKHVKGFALRHTTHWYPHVGSVDRATYDLTFRWPKSLSLVASGRLIDEGADGPSRRFARRRVDRPTSAVSFEVGRFTTVSKQAGHVVITLHVDPSARILADKASRQETLDSLADALTYFEEIFGPYPDDHLEVVTVPRAFSQSLMGFMTLASINMVDPGALSDWLGLQDRRTLVAHEVAHQWWGHRVPWISYRDQWISEAMANYAAVLYARHRLDGQQVYNGPTIGWQRALTRTVGEGRTVESLGPLVLGERLFSSRSSSAYQSIVYKKGAVVVDMLAQRFREDHFLKILQALVQAVDERPISTEDYLTIIERLAGTDLDGFARQFVYGTGLPEIYYDYELARRPEGGWSVRGSARQQSPGAYTYTVVDREGGLDVQRSRRDEIEVTQSSLVVPVQIAVHDPSRKLTKDQRKAKIDPEVHGNLFVKGRVLLDGETTTIDIPLDLEPKELWLDRDRTVFGRFFNENLHPKRRRYEQGIDRAADGDHEAAEAHLRQALTAELCSGSVYSNTDHEHDDKQERRALDAQIHYQLARLHLDRGDRAAARDALATARERHNAYAPRWMKHALRRLEARVAIHDGAYEQAYDLLHKRHRDGYGHVEGLLLYAVAAHGAGRSDVAREAAEAAVERGRAEAGLLLGE